MQVKYMVPTHEDQILGAIDKIEELLALRGNFIQRDDFYTNTPGDIDILRRYTAGEHFPTVEVEVLNPAPEKLTIRVLIPLTKPQEDGSGFEFCTSDTIMRQYVDSNRFRFVTNRTGQIAIRSEQSFHAKETDRIAAYLNSRFDIGKTLSFELKGRLRQAGFSDLVHDPRTDEFWVVKPEEFEHRRPVSSEIVHQDCGGLDVHFTNELAGGGNEFGAELVDFVRDYIGPVDRAFEWCAGPAFMGFDLLGRGLCQSLFLSDINPLALDICRQTIKANKLENKVALCFSDCLDDIPESESWDLVVANPPFSLSEQTIPQWGNPIKYQDPNLDLHERFFRDIEKFLRPGANMLILESYTCTSEKDFSELLERNNLKLKSVHPSERYRFVYHMWITRK